MCNSVLLHRVAIPHIVGGLVSIAKHRIRVWKGGALAEKVEEQEATKNVKYCRYYFHFLISLFSLL